MTPNGLDTRSKAPHTCCSSNPVSQIAIRFTLQLSDRPCVAQWLERSLGVREAGVRSPTVSHQRRKNGRFALLSLALGIKDLGEPTGRLGVSINGLNGSFQLTYGGIESVAWHPKTVGCQDRSAQTRLVHINSHAYTCIHHRIQLAVGDITMSRWKPTISLIAPPLQLSAFKLHSEAIANYLNDYEVKGTPYSAGIPFFYSISLCEEKFSRYLEFSFLRCPKS